MLAKVQHINACRRCYKINVQARQKFSGYPEWFWPNFHGLRKIAVIFCNSWRFHRVIDHSVFIITYVQFCNLQPCADILTAYYSSFSCRPIYCNSQCNSSIKLSNNICNIWWGNEIDYTGVRELSLISIGQMSLSPNVSRTHGKIVKDWYGLRSICQRGVAGISVVSIVCFVCIVEFILKYPGCSGEMIRCPLVRRFKRTML